MTSLATDYESSLTREWPREMPCIMGENTQLDRKKKKHRRADRQSHNSQQIRSEVADQGSNSPPPVSPKIPAPRQRIPSRAAISVAGMPVGLTQ